MELENPKQSILRPLSLRHKKGIFHIPFLCRHNNGFGSHSSLSKITILSFDFFWFRFLESFSIFDIYIHIKKVVNKQKKNR